MLTWSIFSVLGLALGVLSTALWRMYKQIRSLVHKTEAGNALPYETEVLDRAGEKITDLEVLMQRSSSIHEDLRSDYDALMRMRDQYLQEVEKFKGHEKYLSKVDAHTKEVQEGIRNLSESMSVVDGLTSKINAVEGQLTKQSKSYENAEKAYSQSLINIEKEQEKRLTSFTAKLEEVTSNAVSSAYNKLSETANQLSQKQESFSASLSAQIAKVSDHLSADLQSLTDKKTALSQRTDQFYSQTEHYLKALSSQMATRYDQLSNQFKSLHSYEEEQKALFLSGKSALDHLLQDVTDQAKGKMKNFASAIDTFFINEKEALVAKNDQTIAKEQEAASKRFSALIKQGEVEARSIFQGLVSSLHSSEKEAATAIITIQKDAEDLFQALSAKAREATLAAEKAQNHSQELEETCKQSTQMFTLRRQDLYQELSSQAASTTASLQQDLQSHLKNLERDKSTELISSYEALTKEAQKTAEGLSETLREEALKSIVPVKEKAEEQVQQVSSRMASVEQRLAESSKSIAQWQDQTQAMDNRSKELLASLEMAYERSDKEAREKLHSFQSKAEDLYGNTAEQLGNLVAKAQAGLIEMEDKLREQFQTFKNSGSELSEKQAQQFTMELAKLKVNLSEEEKGALGTFFDSQKEELEGRLSSLNKQIDMLQETAQMEYENWADKIENLAKTFEEQKSNAFGELEEFQLQAQSALASLSSKSSEAQEEGLTQLRENIVEAQQSYDAFKKMYDSALSSPEVRDLEALQSRAQELSERLQSQQAEAERALGESSAFVEALSQYEIRQKAIAEQNETIELHQKELITAQKETTHFKSELIALQSSLSDLRALWDDFAEQKEKIMRFDAMIKNTETHYDTLAQEQPQLEELSAQMRSAQDFVSGLSSSLSSLQQGAQATAEQLAEIENEQTALSKRSDEIQRLSAQIDELQEQHSNIEKNSKENYKNLEWLAKTETRITELRDEIKKEVTLFSKVAKNIKNKDFTGDAESGQDQSVSSQSKELVTKLATQKWSPKEISNATGLSLGEVQLILEMSHYLQDAST